VGHDLELNRAHIAAYANRLVPAEGLILVYPVWNEGFPAILKGFFDRVFIPGVSFTVGPDGALVTNLQKLRKILGYMVCRAWLRLSKIQRWTAGSLKGTAQ
jgi:NAD(P)H dehydrogenase (quinone)